MINIREARFWTALLVIGLSTLTFLWAVPTLQFGLAQQTSDAGNAKARLQPFMTQAPIGPSARKLWLALAPPVAPAERVDAFQTLLGSTPLASGAWLDLAIARAAARAPLQDVSSALAMSALTGPNEERFMAGRAMFGLPLWEKLPPDVRRGLIGDLVGGWSTIGSAQREELADQLAIATEQSRAEILAALLLAGKPAEPVIAALDLAPETATEPSGQDRAGSDAERP